MAPRMRVHRASDGFTLLEVLIAMIILGIIMPVIVGTFVLGLKTTDETNRRLLDSANVQRAAAYVGSDVQSSTSLDLGPTSTCIDSAKPADHAVLLLQWDDFSSGSTVQRAVNYYVSGAGLVRTACVGATLTMSSVLISDIDPNVLPSVTCQPTPPGCAANPAPPSIAIRGETVSGHMFSLVGTRRVS